MSQREKVDQNYFLTLEMICITGGHKEIYMCIYEHIVCSRTNNILTWCVREYTMCVHGHKVSNTLLQHTYYMYYIRVRCKSRC